MPHDIREVEVQQRKQSLKQDSFVTTTGHGLSWASENRRSVLITVAILLAAILLAVLMGVIAHAREAAASAAFGDAMETFQSPLITPGQPALPGVTSYANVAERAKAANSKFLAIADKYTSTKDGKNARYFAGVTYLQEGQTQSAESTLKQVADSWDHELSSLGKFALADLYRQSARDPQAIDLYNQLTDKPSDAIPAGLAQLQLADLYTSEGKLDLAHKIYAQLKDKDAKSTAGILAAKKLNPTAPAAPTL